MVSLSYLLSFIHLLGLALGVGAATVKIILRLKANADPTFLPVYARVTKPITKTLILGIVLLTLSGIVWLIQGYSFTTLIVVKIVLVGLVWVLGISIDNVFEPRFLKLIPAAGSSPSPEFTSAAKVHLVLDTVAALLMYAIMILGTRI